MVRRTKYTPVENGGIYPAPLLTLGGYTGLTAPRPGKHMNRVTLNDLVEALNLIPERYFGFDTVSDCLKTHPVDPASLANYRFFSSSQPTCNVIIKNDLFELVAMCWDVAQKSPIQAYADSRIWSVACMGRLQLRTFRIKQETGNVCEIEQTDVFEIHATPAAISPAEPIHEWTNLLSYRQQAVSLHVFSPPVETVTVYARNKTRVQRINHETHDGRMIWRLS